jgi:hypothetical protein
MPLIKRMGVLLSNLLWRLWKKALLYCLLAWLDSARTDSSFYLVKNSVEALWKSLGEMEVITFDWRPKCCMLLISLPIKWKPGLQMEKMRINKIPI